MIIHIVGTRPNYMKCVPLYMELEKRGQEQVIIHSGQHYDYHMSDMFFKDLSLYPDINLNVNAGCHGETVGMIMIELEPHLKGLKPDHVVVYGDVNTTLAAALVVSKMRVSLHHIEAGLRSFDLTMPEEINRMLVDRVSDYLYTPTFEASRNVDNEIGEIYMVGNIMIDCIKLFKDEIIKPKEKGYVFVTLHRPSNVDNFERLKKIITELKKFPKVIFPAHPRTKIKGIETIKPVGYLECLGYQSYADLIITDSGGIQAEAAYLGTPCLVLRDSSEWSFSTLIEPEQMDTKPKYVINPEEWDGHTSIRIADKLIKIKQK